MFYQEIDDSLTIMDMGFIYAKLTMGYQVFLRKDFSLYPVASKFDLQSFDLFNLLGSNYDFCDWSHVLVGTNNLCYSPPVPILVRDDNPHGGFYVSLAQTNIFRGLSTGTKLGTLLVQTQEIENFRIGFNPLYIQTTFKMLVPQPESYIVRKVKHS